MINIENIVTASPKQLLFIIEGMRNPLNSWDKSDSYDGYDCTACGKIERDGICKPSDEERKNHQRYYGITIGENDLILMRKLANSGPDHRKFMRMMPVYMRITAPLYWWKEFDTYKVGTVTNSCSTMHKIQEKKFTIKDFSYEHLFNEDDENPNRTPIDNNCLYYRSSKSVLQDTVNALNQFRNLYIKTKEKDYWWQMIQLLPSSYNQTRNVMLNYEVLADIYKSRKNHKLDEWVKFCKFVELSVPYSFLITGDNKLTADNGAKSALDDLTPLTERDNTTRYRYYIADDLEILKEEVEEKEKEKEYEK